MAKPTVYVETTIVSYLTAWPSSDMFRQAQQDLTRHWWRDRAPSFSLVTSQFVLMKRLPAIRPPPPSD